MLIVFCITCNNKTERIEQGCCLYVRDKLPDIIYLILVAKMSSIYIVIHYINIQSNNKTFPYIIQGYQNYKYFLL